MGKRRRPPASVREPIQVYLDRGERARLDRLAQQLGVSRAEVLRQALERFDHGETSAFYDGFAPLVGAFSNARAPTDLALRHKHYLTRELAARKAVSRRRSS
jgi:hypothetical protein